MPISLSEKLNALGYTFLATEKENTVFVIGGGKASNLHITPEQFKSKGLNVSVKTVPSYNYTKAGGISETYLPGGGSPIGYQGNKKFVESLATLEEHLKEKTIPIQGKSLTIDEVKSIYKLPPKSTDPKIATPIFNVFASTNPTDVPQLVSAYNLEDSVKQGFKFYAPQDVSKFLEVNSDKLSSSQTGQNQEDYKNLLAGKPVQSPYYDFDNKMVTEDYVNMTPEQKKYAEDLKVKMQAEQATATKQTATGAYTPSGLDVPTGDQAIPFKTGLTDTQKKSIQTLLDTGKAFNETDAKNYAYATGQTN